MEELKNTSGELTAEEKAERRKRQLANLKPFRKDDERTKECAVKGGTVRGSQLAKAKNLKELANMLLETRISRERAEKVLGEVANDIPEEDLTNGALLIGSMLTEVIENKTAKAAEYLRDTSGQKIRDEISVDLANTMTDNDRALVSNMADILSEILTKKSDITTK